MVRPLARFALCFALAISANTGFSANPQTDSDTGMVTVINATLTGSYNVSDEYSTQQAPVSGDLMLDASGNFLAFNLIVESVSLSRGTTGLITVQLDASVPVSGYVAATRMDLNFGVKVNTVITDEQLGLVGDTLFCAGGTNPGNACTTNSDCTGGGVCSMDSRAGQFEPCSANVFSIVENGAYVGTLTITCPDAKNTGLLSISSPSPPAPGSLQQRIEQIQKAECPAPNKAIRKNSCVQPVVIANADGSNRTACPDFSVAVNLFRRCCTSIFVNVPTAVINDPTFKTLDESPNSTPTAQETRLFALQNDDNTTEGCIEVYCVDQFMQGVNVGKDISGGGGTYFAGTARAKVVIVDGAVPEVLAHEIGHAFDLDHLNGSIMQPTGRHNVASPQRINLNQCRGVNNNVNAQNKGAGECCMTPNLPLP